MSAGEVLTKLTVWVALGAYGLACGGMLRACPDAPRPLWIRWLWTLGCLIFLMHVACAFAFYHAWSHAEAYRETARQTRAMTGMDWGGGLYFNYLFAALWFGDVLWWWRAPFGHAGRPRAVGVALHGFLFFLVVNGAVVFVGGPMKWFGLAFCVALAALWLRRLLRRLRLTARRRAA